MLHLYIYNSSYNNVQVLQPVMWMQLVTGSSHIHLEIKKKKKILTVDITACMR